MAPAGATRLRVVAELGGQFSPEETAPLASGMGDATGGGGQPRPALRQDAPATMTSRFEPRDTAAAFAALDRLARIPDAAVRGGSAELNGGRSEGDFLTLRLGRDVPMPAAVLAQKVKDLSSVLASPTQTLKLRLDGIAFPSGRDLTRFCDDCGEDFDRVSWTQD
jgi:hypothetical protein